MADHYPDTHKRKDNELPEDRADGLVPGRDALAELALRERRVGFREGLDDALLEGFRLWGALVRHLPLEPQA